ncbi:phosphoglycerate mutase-like protein [Xylaria scruposa]|nr:phosphoglycerate mutase-like protein [Xylaria scruposa]
MAPVIDVIRHAESTHNITRNAYLRDPDLTTEGKSQAYRFGRSYGFMGRISHVVSSPMRRAIRTSLIAFEDVLLDGKKVILLPELQETGVRPSDIGQPPAALEIAFRPQVDIGLVERDWYHKDQSSKYIPDLALVEARAREARVFLRELAQSGPDDAHIIVVSHAGFLHFLTEDFSGLSEQYFTTYGNMTMRSFQFVDLYGDDPDAKMVQTEESCRRSRFPRFVDMSETDKERLKSYAVKRVKRQKEEFDSITQRNQPPA